MVLFFFLELFGLDSFSIDFLYSFDPVTALDFFVFLAENLPLCFGDD